MKSERCKGKVLLIWFQVEVWIERIKYSHMCFESTAMQVMYDCFILLDLANNVKMLPLQPKNIELHCLAECPNFANSIIAGSCGDVCGDMTALFSDCWRTSWPFGSCMASQWLCLVSCQGLEGAVGRSSLLLQQV